MTQQNELIKEFLIDQGYIGVQVVDAHWYAILRFLYTAAIIKGNTKDYAAGYDDRWCYHTSAEAIIALARWMDEDFKDEPKGWHRNPSSGRRRVDGDETKEYVNF